MTFDAPTLFPDTYAELDRLEGPTARHDDPDTSHAAAEVARVNAGTARARALRVLAGACAANGLTDFELAERTGIAQTSIGVRRKELERAGYVERTDERRPAPSGASAIVWRITPAGVAKNLELASDGLVGDLCVVSADDELYDAAYGPASPRREYVTRPEREGAYLLELLDELPTDPTSPAVRGPVLGTSSNYRNPRNQR